jgi:hypothetical protein
MSYCQAQRIAGARIYREEKRTAATITYVKVQKHPGRQRPVAVIMLEQDHIGPYELSREDAEEMRDAFGDKFSDWTGKTVYVCHCHRLYEGDTCTTVGCLSVATTEDAGFEPIEVIKSDSRLVERIG